MTRILFLVLYFIFHFATLGSTQIVKAEYRINLAKIGLVGIDKISGIQSSGRLIKVWDSLESPEAKLSILDIMPETEWEQVFVKHYDNSSIGANKSVKAAIGLILTGIYHRQARFDKKLPILEYLNENIEVLANDEQKSVLLQLENVYRGRNDIAKAILVRNQRFSKNYVSTFWEIYRDCGLFEAAINDFKLFQEKPQKNILSTCLYYWHLGNLFLDNNQLDSARKYYEFGLTNIKRHLQNSAKLNSFDLIDAQFWRGNFMGDIAQCDYMVGKYAKAIKPLLYDISFSNYNATNRVYKSLILADCYLKLNNLQNAKKYIDSVRLNSLQIMSQRDLLTLYRISALYFKKINQFDSAFYYSESYNKFSDTLSTRIQQGQSVLLLVNFEINKRRAELKKSANSLVLATSMTNTQKTQLVILIVILLVLLSIVILLVHTNIEKSRNKKLIDLEIMRNDTLLKELHHRVKNNLQVMYSLLNMQKRRNDNIATINTLTSIQNRIQTMALVHQNLYTSGNFEVVDLASYTKTLVNHLSSIYQIENKKINIIFDIQADCKLPIEKVVSIGLILNEAISNAFKYAFLNIENAQLLIQLSNNKSQYIIKISDNGEGFHEEVSNKKSLGLILIKLMSAQLNATYTLEKEEGVTHIIEFETI